MVGKELTWNYEGLHTHDEQHLHGTELLLTKFVTTTHDYCELDSEDEREGQQRDHGHDKSVLLEVLGRRWIDMAHNPADVLDRHCELQTGCRKTETKADDQRRVLLRERSALENDVYLEEEACEDAEEC